jgi:HD-like signal output (HDOD) protein
MARDLSGPCRELLRLSGGNEPDLQEIARFLREQPLLEQRVLRHVNSIGVGLRNRVSGVEHAVALLGAGRLRSLAQHLLDESPQTQPATRRDRP